jgi:DNA-binding transcriptional ArsR family regulator
MKTEELDKTFAALADPTRRAILERLMEGDATVAEIGRPFDMSMPAISKHLKVLEHAGLISRDREAQKRPSHLEVERLREATEWMERYRQIWEARLDRLEVQLEKIQKQQEGQKK